MGCKLLAIIFFVSCFTNNQQSFVNTAPLDTKTFNQKFEDEAVKELESLKNIFEGSPRGNHGGDISVSKSQTTLFSDVNGQKSAFRETKNEMDKNGKLFAKVTHKVDVSKGEEGKPLSVSTTELEIPSKGIHNVILKNEPSMTNEALPSKKLESVNSESLGARNGIEKINSLSGLEYSPLDMAEYIFWTGDEKGVAVTIEEFLEEGLMTRQEAINFLQSIKHNLDFMQAHYQGLQKVDEKTGNKERNVKQEIFNQDKYKSELGEEHRDNAKVSPYDMSGSKSEFFGNSQSKVKSNFYQDSTSLLEGENSGQEDSKSSKSQGEMKALKKSFNAVSVNDDDYDDLMERLRVANFLSKEYSLEEVIYQLAKVMFSQSLSKGNKEAQNALEKFTALLQKGVKHNQISKNFERKILDVLLTALFEIISEHPELIDAAKEELQNMKETTLPKSTMLKELLASGMASQMSGLFVTDKRNPQSSALEAFFKFLSQFVGKLNLKELADKDTLSVEEKSPERPLKKIQ